MPHEFHGYTGNNAFAMEVRSKGHPHGMKVSKPALSGNVLNACSFQITADEWVFAKRAIAINLIQAHDYAQAQKTIEDIIERFPEDAASHVMLGNLFLDLRKLDKARETFAAAVRIDPSNTAAGEGFERAGKQVKQP